MIESLKDKILILEKTCTVQKDNLTQIMTASGKLLKERDTLYEENLKMKVALLELMSYNTYTKVVVTRALSK